MSNNNKKILNIDIYERLSVIETKIEIFTKKVDKYVERNDNEHKSFISIKAFGSWLGALSIIIAIITTILFLMR